MQKHRDSRRGNAIMEFAVGSVMFFAFFAGTFEFGYGFYVYNNLLNAVNSGAKYAAAKTYDSNTGTPSAAYETAVRNMVVYGDPTGATKNPVAVDLKPENVTVQVAYSDGAPKEVTVGIESYSLNALFAKFAIAKKPRITYPYLGPARDLWPARGENNAK